MNPPSSSNKILPELSRSYKSRLVTTTADSTLGQKRKLDSSSCFEVRPCPKKGGVGMFATQNILPGSLIISHEAPIVSSSQTSTNVFCSSCKAPVGSLRDHLGAPSDLALPYLEAKSNGVEFSSQQIHCSECQVTVWCSKRCQERQALKHSLTCPHSSPTTQQQALADFLESLEDVAPLIFQLAVEVITLVVSKVIQGQANLSESNLYWWRDYGSHPLWWQLGSARQDLEVSERRNRQVKLFSSVLQDMLLESIQSNKDVVHCSKNTMETWTKKLCSPEPVAEILGMLQCNVMEFEYPSPAQQYVGFLQQDGAEEEETDHDCGETDDCEEPAKMANDKLNNEAESKVSRTQEAALTWLVANGLLSEKEEEAECEGGHDTQSAGATKSTAISTAVVGSGLYPLLTLANHDCNPNASIDFLQESNRGSMVAIREIAVGEEITITYVPNGDVGQHCEDRFQHFQPTRTWKWLHQFDKTASEDENCDENSGSDCDTSHLGHSDDTNGVTSPLEVEADDRGSDLDSTTDEDSPPEGASYKDRRAALREYSFECQCRRCLDEQVKDEPCTLKNNRRDYDSGDDQVDSESEDEAKPKKAVERSNQKESRRETMVRKKERRSSKGVSEGMINLESEDEEDLKARVAEPPTKRKRFEVLVKIKTHPSQLELSSYRALVMRAVSEDGMLLRHACPECRDDREIVLQAVTQNGWALQFSSQTMRNDREIVLLAVSKTGLALQFASEALRNDGDVVLTAAKNDTGYRYAGQTLWDDRRFVLRAVSLNGYSFQRASQRLRDDREIAFAAVSDRGSALMYASETVKNDRDVVMRAVSTEGSALGYASQMLQRDREVVLQAVSKRGWALRYASPHLKSDAEIVQRAVFNSGFALEYAAHKFRDDPAIVGAAIRSMGSMIRGPNPITNYVCAVYSLRRKPSLELQDRVQNVLEGLQKCKPTGIFTNQATVHEHATRLRTIAWQKILQINQVTGTEFATRTILEFSDLASEFSFATELDYVAPVIGACAEYEIDWSDICIANRSDEF